jgi:hypothetical protein
MEIISTNLSQGSMNFYYWQVAPPAFVSETQIKECQLSTNTRTMQLGKGPLKGIKIRWYVYIGKLSGNDGKISS